MAGELIETHVSASGVEFLVLRGDLGGSVLWNVGYSGVEGWEEFKALFEIDSEDYLGWEKDSFYQVITFTRLVRRRADGAVFGSSYWYSPGNDGIEGQASGPDADTLGIEVDWENDEPDPVIFVPVKRFERVGYQLDTSGLI